MQVVASPCWELVFPDVIAPADKYPRFVIPAQAGIQQSTGCRIKSGMTGGGYLVAGLISLQSLLRRLDPYPGVPLRCFCPFLPGELQPHNRCTKFGAPNNRHNATSMTTPFRGGSHFVMFRLPRLLAPQMAPTAQARSPTGSRVVYTTQWTGSYFPELWYRYMTESDNYHGGTFTRWIAALSAAPTPIKL